MGSSRSSKEKYDRWFWVAQENEESITDKHMKIVYGLIRPETKTDSQPGKQVEADSKPKVPSLKLTDIFQRMSQKKSEQVLGKKPSSRECLLHNICMNCRLNSNSVNCSTNPYCLHKLGFESLEELVHQSEKTQSDDPDTDCKYRQITEPAGLKNLGATCYVNTYLQLWFHNHVFRNIIYSIVPKDDYSTQSALVTNLQYIFSLLQISLNSCIDPSPLIEALGLSAHIQQDATEFSKLFIDRLTNEQIKNMFSAHYQQIIKCCECGTESKTTSQYLELELSTEGIPSLNKALDNYFQNEKLEGDNQYACSACMVKRDANKYIRLKSLPPILNIQLLRFVYDKRTLRRKKLTHIVKFPDKLNLRNRLTSPNGGEDYTYELAAVLMHNGSQADQGHYTAHIKIQTGLVKSSRASDSIWYSFNDEQVEPIDIEDVNLMKKLTVQRTKEAYMLVYYKSTSISEIQSSKITSIPKHIQDMIGEENSQIREQISLNQLQIVAAEQQLNELRKELMTVFTSLPVSDVEEECYFIPTSWLEKITSLETHEVPEIDNECILCTHGKLNWTCVNEFKAVSKQQGEMLYNKYSSGHTIRLSSNTSLCSECVTAEFRFRKLKLKVESDHQIIQQYLSNKTQQNEDTGPLTNGETTRYWVSKSELKNWRNARLKPVEVESRRLVDSTQEEVTTNDDIFNSSVICEHGSLSLDERSRQLICKQIWDILTSHFSHAVTYDEHADMCNQCQIDEEMFQQKEEMLRTFIKLNKKILNNFLSNVRRPVLTELSDSTVYVLSTSTYQLLTNIISKSKGGEFDGIVNKILLCEHEKLVYHPADQNNVMLLWEEEWNILTSNLSYDEKIIIKSSTDNQPFITQPDICYECLTLREKIEKESRYKFTDSTIYVQLVEADDEQASKRRCVEVPTDEYKIQYNTNNNANNHTINSTTRRTTRRAVPRGCKQLKTSSTSTLLHLKTQLLEIYSISPIDQLVSLDGTDLTNNESTLEQLKLYPYCCIKLQADVKETEDNPQESGVEGFTGTSLLPAA